MPGLMTTLALLAVSMLAAGPGRWERHDADGSSFELPGTAERSETTRETSFGPLRRVTHEVRLDEGEEQWSVRIHFFPPEMRRIATDEQLFDATWRGGHGAASGGAGAKPKVVQLVDADGRRHPGRQYSAKSGLVRGDTVFYLVGSTLYELTALRGHQATMADFERFVAAFRLSHPSSTPEATESKGFGLVGTGPGGGGTGLTLRGPGAPKSPPPVHPRKLGFEGEPVARMIKTGTGANTFQLELMDRKGSAFSKKILAALAPKLHGLSDCYADFDHSDGAFRLYFELIVTKRGTLEATAATWNSVPSYSDDQHRAAWSCVRRWIEGSEVPRLPGTPVDLGGVLMPVY